MAEERAKGVLEALRRVFKMPKSPTANYDPFEMLVMTIISQNTNYKNTIRAFENLSKALQISPEALAKAKINQLEQPLKTAGLYKKKAKVIRQVSRIISEKYGGSLETIISLPTEEARELLLQLPGVGPKTADVVLLFTMNMPLIPVDTHVNRVSKRLGLAPSKGNYETVRFSLQSLYKSEDYHAVHVYLIFLGRNYCKPGKPLCQECPANELCPSRKLWDKSG